MTQEAHFLIMACIVVTSKIVLLVARFDLFREYCEALTYQYMYSMKDLFNLNLTNVQIEKMVSESPYQSLRSTFLNSIVMYFLAGIFIWMLVKIRKGEGNLRQYLSIMAYAHIPLVLSYLFLGLVSIGTNELYFNSSFTSIGYYFPGTVSPFLKGIHVWRGTICSMEIHISVLWSEVCNWLQKAGQYHNLHFYVRNFDVNIRIKCMGWRRDWKFVI